MSLVFSKNEYQASAQGRGAVRTRTISLALPYQSKEKFDHFKCGSNAWEPQKQETNVLEFEIAEQGATRLRLKHGYGSEQPWKCAWKPHFDAWGLYTEIEAIEGGDQSSHELLAKNRSTTKQFFDFSFFPEVNSCAVEPTRIELEPGAECELTVRGELPEDVRDLQILAKTDGQILDVCKLLPAATDVRSSIEFPRREFDLGEVASAGDLTLEIPYRISGQSEFNGTLVNFLGKTELLSLVNLCTGAEEKKFRIVISDSKLHAGAHSANLRMLLNSPALDQREFLFHVKYTKRRLRLLPASPECTLGDLRSGGGYAVRVWRDYGPKFDAMKPLKLKVLSPKTGVAIFPDVKGGATLECFGVDGLDGDCLRVYLEDQVLLGDDQSNSNACFAIEIKVVGGSNV
jgi:hypothetical protein